MVKMKKYLIHQRYRFRTRKMDMEKALRENEAYRDMLALKKYMFKSAFEFIFID